MMRMTNKNLDLRIYNIKLKIHEEVTTHVITFMYDDIEDEGAQPLSSGDPFSLEYIPHFRSNFGSPFV